MSQPPYPPPEGQAVPDPQYGGSFQPDAQGASYPPPRAGSPYGVGPYIPFGQAAPPEAKPPVYKRPWFVVLTTLVVVGIVGAIVQGTEDKPSSEAASTSSQSESPALQTEVAPPPTTQAVAPPPAPTTEPEPVEPVGVSFTMPDFVGMDLQSAQNLVQTHGVFFSRSHDLRGSRMQVLDSNWIVCDQNIPAGQQVTGEAEGQIDFGVVKREESCP